MQGARPGSETHNVSWKAAIRMEASRLRKCHYAAASETQPKFCDSIEYEVTWWAFEVLEMPEEELRPMRGLHHQLQCRFKLGTALSEIITLILPYASGLLIRMDPLPSLKDTLFNMCAMW